MFEPERQHIDIYPLPVCLRAEQIDQLAAQLGCGEGGAVQHKVRMVAYRLQHLAFDLNCLGDTASVRGQRMHAPCFLIAVDNNLCFRLQKQHTAIDTAGFQILQRFNQQIKGFTGTHIVHQRHAVIASGGRGAELRELRHHLRRKIIHDIVSHILQISGCTALSAAGKTGYNQYFHAAPPYPMILTSGSKCTPDA